MPLVITVLHVKGGVGKTTLSVCFAGEMVERGYEPLLIDADQTASAQAWAKPGRLDFSVVGYPVVPGQAEEWKESIRKLQADLLVIDCGPNEYSLTAACALADVVILPCGASGLDVDATANALALLHELRATRAMPLSVIIVPTRVDGRTLEGRQIVEELAGFGEIVTPPLSYRVDYVRAFAEGMSVNGYAPGSVADSEIKAAVDQLMEYMSIRSAA